MECPEITKELSLLLPFQRNEKGMEEAVASTKETSTYLVLFKFSHAGVVDDQKVRVFLDVASTAVDCLPCFVPRLRDLNIRQDVRIDEFFLLTP